MDRDLNSEIATQLAILRSLQSGSGVFTASAKTVSTGYDKAWLRDNYFIILGFLEAGDVETTKRAARALLDVFIKHKDKIDWAIENKPQETWQYIHARFHPETFEEFWEEWGNKQHDAVGEVLNLIVTLELSGNGIVASDDDRGMVQKIIDYLSSIEYWHDPDNGIWEENLEVHASSIGSCVAALRKAQQLSWLQVSHDIILKGEEALRTLLPRESEGKFSDLALLSLIYPFAVTTEEETLAILRNVEYHLTKDKGVIRYKGDRYYNNNSDQVSEEAEWCFGLAWLSIIYALRGDRTRAEQYLTAAQSALTKEGLMPELYYSHTDKPNENTPLGWSVSMYIIALTKMRDMQ